MLFALFTRAYFQQIKFSHNKQAYQNRIMSEISNLGEFGLINHLTQDIKQKNAETQYGIGDDCAVVRFSQDKDLLITTDMLMEGIHFDLTYMPLKHLGYKSAMVNFSDVYAMGGIPKQITISIALSQRFSVEAIEEFYSGIRLACDHHNVDIVGGDTTSSLTGLAISITCIGEVERGKAIYRNGAKETDLVCVSGDLGGAYMGLQLLEREKVVYYEQLKKLEKLEGEARELAAMEMAQPDFHGKEYLLERQMRPEARGDIISKLHDAGIHPSSMIDISDGLSSELMHICNQSGVGCRIYEERIPLDYQTAVMAEELNMNVSTCALNGGEDYELLFTVPLSEKDKIETIEDVKMIGYITKSDLGMALITRDGNEFELKAQGWNHLGDKQ